MSGRPKIMFVIDSLGSGGAERSLVELLPHLLDLGAHPVVATLRATEVGFEEDARATGVPIFRVEGTNALGRVRSLRKLIRVEAPDLVHTTLYRSDILGRLACGGTGVQVSTSLVNTSYDPARYSDPSISRWKLELVRCIDGWTARNLCHHFHAITGAVKDASIGALGIDPSRVAVIPRGRDWSRLGEPNEVRRATARGDLGLKPSQPVLLNIGRQEYQKGQQHLIEAVGLLVRDHPDVKLLVAGREGNVSARLRSAIVEGALGDSVTLLGYRSDVGDLLTAADVFVFPSVYEGLGGSLLEAMMMEVPAVVSDIPTFREVLGTDYPLLCAQDPESIATVVHRLLSDETLRCEIVERNLARVRDLLSGEPTRALASQLVTWASVHD